MGRQTFGSLVPECKRSAWQDSEEADTKWKRFQKKKKELIKCVASSEACMCQAFASANNLRKQLLGYRRRSSKTNFRPSFIASNVRMEIVMVMGHLCRQCQAIPRGRV